MYGLFDAMFTMHYAKFKLKNALNSHILEILGSRWDKVGNFMGQEAKTAVIHPPHQPMQIATQHRPDSPPHRNGAADGNEP